MAIRVSIEMRRTTTERDEAAITSVGPVETKEEFLALAGDLWDAIDDYAITTGEEPA